MSQPDSRSSSVSNQRRRSFQSRPRKRQRQYQSDSSRPPSSNSTGTSIGRHYGVGDDDALYNLFASYPETFTTAPRPHGSRGLNEPPWELRFDQEIQLSNDFTTRGTRSQRVRMPIPGPEIGQLPSSSPQQSAQQQSSPTKPQFQSALF
ncbi:hypothetical protein EDB81DRAFT_248672 [Dactylonectria macrodidyma]|uniref:Uncharacterized protein n=1 Tax=Dactylonectria macrodidyma TaxID=307937 RepID=A0A9P9DH97_9HYPO|nr:hypothetical protein EDB81DRAFT_235096 [Dactylonectria macrodidyma]KAH7165173.1 hypothetical protein EDB81DRAFT_248672 [Dactylonectria macrodidyma]